MRIDTDVQNNAITECDACEHIPAYRLLVRGNGNVYSGREIQVIQGPYFTLVQSVARAKIAQQGGVVSNCGFGTLTGLVSSPAINDAFCAIDWDQPVSVTGSSPNDGSPHYKHVPITYAVSLGMSNTHLVYVTIAPLSSGWVITHVRRIGK